jgi:hypothetical protein
MRLEFRIPLPLIAAAGLALLACGRNPELAVEQAPAEAPRAEAPAAPAADAPVAPADDAPALQMARAHPSTPTLPEGHPPLDGAPAESFAVAPVDPGTGRGGSALVWSAPAAWIAEPPANTMRRAQYRIPGPGGDGECVVFYFGPGQGGDPMSNAERWAAQFEQPDGRPPSAAMKTRTAQVGDIPVLYVETTGTYHAGSMIGMGQGVPKPGWALLGAVAQGPDAHWFFKLTAPAATAEAHRAGFEQMIASLRRGG